MDTVETWVTKIAREVAPDEVDLAPSIAAAFLGGDRARGTPGGPAGSIMPGGFGVAHATVVMEAVMHGLGLAAPALASFLLSGPTERLLRALRDLLGIRDSLARRQRADSLPDDPYGPLRRVIDVMSTELRAANVPAEQSELITYRVLRMLLEAPTEARPFIEQLAETR